MRWYLADRLLVTDETVEHRRQFSEQRILQPGNGERDTGRLHGFTEGAVHRRTLVSADRANAVTDAEEREIALNHSVEEG